MHEIIAELERVRARSRAMLLLQRGSLIVTTVIAAFFLLITLDWLLRLPAAARTVLLVGGLVGIGWSLVKFILPAVRFHPSLVQLALRAESVMPALAGRLASSVEFAAAGIDHDNQLAARSVQDAQRRLAGAKVAEMISGRRTIKGVTLLAIAAILGALFVYSNPAGAQTGLMRLIAPYSDAQWPARTGVDSMMTGDLLESGVYPRGLALPLRAQVTRGPEDQRVTAHLRYQSDGQWMAWQRVVLTHQDSGIHERLVDTNAERIEFYFATADAQTEMTSLELVATPAVRRASVSITPPAYASGRISPAELELGPGTDARAVTERASLVGSHVDLLLELNKPLPVPGADAQRDSWLRSMLGWDESALPAFAAADEIGARWRLTWTLDQTRSLNLTLIDEYGLSNPEPISYRLEAMADTPPAVTITEPATDRAVLPDAQVQLVAEASDDVAVSQLGVDAFIELASAGDDEDDGDQSDEPAWAETRAVDAATAKLETMLDLGPLELNLGDVVVVSAAAQDQYELNGERHAPARSVARRLRVISELDFATQLRQQLSAVRQNAIRIESMQGELQDDIVDDGVQPGVDRAQAQIGERIAQQREAAEEVLEELEMNRLEDPQLEELIRQTQDILEFAGRASGRASQAIEQRQGGQQRDAQARQRDEQARAGDRQAGQQRQGDDPQAGEQPQGQQGEQGQQGQPQQGDQGDEQPDAPQRADEDDLHEPAPEDREIFDAQQEVRDELSDLIELLDRNEDTWVISRRVAELIERQERLQRETERLAQETVGLSEDELSPEQRQQQEQLARAQSDLADETRELPEEMRGRAQALEDSDPQAANALRNAAETTEQRGVSSEMERAEARIEENQMQTASGNQQRAIDALRDVQEDLDEQNRARAEQLLRQLESLVESINRLIVVQENELIALARSVEAEDFTGRDRAMIRLNQNTQAVEGEARAAGQQARRIARALDRAADAQGAAVTALRATPVLAAEAEEAENRSLEMLKEAKTLAEELQEQTQEDETRRRREELIAAYREYAEREVAIREESLELSKAAQLDRRQLVEARRLGSRQEDIGAGLRELRDITRELMEAAIFNHTHQRIDDLSQEIADSLLEGRVDIEVTDRQEWIVDMLGRLIVALEEAMATPDPFEDGQENEGGEQGGDQQGQQQQPQELIPPVAELKLLQGLQEQVYDVTRDTDRREDLTEAQRRNRLRDIGREQRDLMDLGREMVEKLNPAGANQLSPPEEGDPAEQGGGGAGDGGDEGGGEVGDDGGGAPPGDNESENNNDDGGATS